MKKREEKILLKNCIRGYPDAQKKLYDLYAKDMFHVCRSYAPDYDTANDFLQEGFLKIFKNLHKYKSSGSLGGWMRSVVVNTSIDLLRKDKKHRYNLQFEDYMSDDSASNDSHSDPLNAINTDSFFEIIKELPAGYRTILNLYYLEEYTHKEIAEKLNISAGTSKSQLSKSKKYLKTILLKRLSKDEIEFYVGKLVKIMV